MGIYPTVTNQPLPDDGLLVHTSTPEGKRFQIYTLTHDIFIRENCYCCTCENDYSGPDPFCRNHGWIGTRPCDIHGMPGDKDDPDDPTNRILTVLEKRAYDKRLTKPGY